MPTLITDSVHRILPSAPFESLDAYVAVGGGEGLRAARAVTPEIVIAELEASGLRGRGGAGFPTGTKWRTVVGFRSAALRTSVVVNAAEGEPGTFKDRAILRANPFAVLEGALIAAHAMESRGITVALKRRFTTEHGRLIAAIAELRRAGWCDGIEIDIVEGPDEYLFGEETALLEALDGRPPFPRIAPPWRRGTTEVVRYESDLTSGSGLAADVQMATREPGSIAPPVLVNNVETLANVPGIIAKGAQWFRSVGTAESPGTIVCTVTGAVARAGVVEIALGTPLRAVLDDARDDSQPAISSVLLGVSNAILTIGDLDTPMSYEGMRSLGSGLGSASFIVVDDTTSPLALAAGASRFLAVESCGQCTACKQVGLQTFEGLRSLCVEGGSIADLDRIVDGLGTITDGARCNLAAQHLTVVGSILDAFEEVVAEELASGVSGGDPVLITELASLGDGVATSDDAFLSKRADWVMATTVPRATTADRVDDPGSSPADRFGDHRSHRSAGE